MTTHNVPPWLRSHIDTQGLHAISSAVQEAEKHTRCEIVPMIVQRVYRSFHLNIMLFLAFEVVGCIGILYASHSYAPFPIGLTVAAWTAASLLLTPLMSRSVKLQRFMADPIAIRRAVEARAELEFYRHNLNVTAEGTGVLIFIAWWDRQVAVLADKAIAASFPPEYWDTIVATILQSIQRRSLAHGLTQAIHDCGQRLAALFPIRANDINELSDHLIIIEDE